MPFPKILQNLLFEITLIPNFLTVLIAALTSSEINKFSALEFPLANDANKTHLILILLSPLTTISLLKFFNFFFITIEFVIDTYLKLKLSPK